MGLSQRHRSWPLSINIVVHQRPFLDQQPHCGLQPHLSVISMIQHQGIRQRIKNFLQQHHQQVSHDFSLQQAICNQSGQQRHQRPSSTQEAQPQRHQQTIRMMQQYQYQPVQQQGHQQQHRGGAQHQQLSSPTHHRAHPSSSSSSSTTTSQTSTWTMTAEPLNNHKMPCPKNANLIIINIDGE